MGSLQFILGNPKTGKSYYIYKYIIEESIKNPNQNYLVVVPNNFILTTKIKILDMHPKNALFNINIVSFEGLIYLILEKLNINIKDIISKEERYFILKKILDDKKNEFKIISCNENTIGNLKSISLMISELSDFNIVIKDLNIEDNDKLKDIILLKKYYDEYISNKYVEKEDLFILLSDKLKETNILNNTTFVIDEFNDLKNNKKYLIYSLLEKSKKVYIVNTISKKAMEENIDSSNIFYIIKKYIKEIINTAKGKNILVEDNIYPNYVDNVNEEIRFLIDNIFIDNKKIFDKEIKNIKKIHLRNIYDEIDVLANNILKFICNGYKYEDICVIVPSDVYLKYIDEKFCDYNINYFVTNNYNLLENKFIYYIRNFLKLSLDDFSINTVLEILKSKYSILKNTFKLENYIIENNINSFKKWNRPFISKNKYQLKKELDEININRKIFIDNISPFIISNKKHTCLEISNSIRNFIDKNNYKTIIDNEVKELISNKIFVDANIYSQVLDIFLDILRKIDNILGNEKISLQEYINLLDFILSEVNIKLKNNINDFVQIVNINDNKINNSKILFILGLNDTLIPINKINSKLFNDFERKKLIDNKINLNINDIDYVNKQTYYFYLALSSVSEHLILSYFDIDEEGDNVGESRYLNNIGDLFNKLKTDEKLNFNNENTYKIFNNKQGLKKIINKDLINKLYDDKLQISQIQSFASCPYAHFIKYGLKLKNKNRFELSSADKGTILHNIFKDIFSEKFYDFDKDELINYVNNLCDKEIRLNYKDLFDENPNLTFIIKEISRITTNYIKDIVLASSFRNSECELNIFFKDELLNLSGRIDRVDYVEEDNNIYLKIVDYKTSKKFLKLNDIYNMVNIQLIMYIKMAQNYYKNIYKNKNIIVGGIEYFILHLPVFKSDDYSDIKKEYISSNYYLKNEEFLNKLFSNNKDYKESFYGIRYTKDGSLNKHITSLKTKEYIDLLIDYVFFKIKDILKDIYGGDISINPKKDSCENCEYKSICRFDNKEMVLKKENDKEIEKKMKEYVDNKKKEIII